MKTLHLAFVIKVPEGGFHWTEIAAYDPFVGRNRPVISLVPANRNLICRGHLEDFPFLWHEFAKLPLEPTKLLKFAERYGPLGGSVLAAAHTRQMAGGASVDEPCYEHIDDWKRAVAEIAVAVELWEVLRGDRAYRLAELVKQTVEFLGTRHFLNGHGATGAGSSATIGSSAMRALINGSLRREQAALVLPESGRQVALAPSSLLGAIWAQLALSVSLDEPGRKCVVCGKWFPAKLRDARLCSPRCRQFQKRHGADSIRGQGRVKK